MATAEKPMVGWLREDALKSILEQPEDTRFGNRDLAFMILMYESGARVSEMLDLHIRDLNFFDSGSSVRLHGKGKKTREVPIGDKARAAVEKHLSHWFGDSPCGADDYVFFTVIHGMRYRCRLAMQSVS